MTAPQLEDQHRHSCELSDLDAHEWTCLEPGHEPDSHLVCTMHADPEWVELAARIDNPTRVPARDTAETGRAPATSNGGHDPAQQARRAMLWYLATGTPAPYPGMPDWHELVRHDGQITHELIRILVGLINPGLIGSGWDQVAMYANQLREVLAAGGVGTTAEAYTESMLLDAINTCAPDREAP